MAKGDSIFGTIGAGFGFTAVFCRLDTAEEEEESEDLRLLLLWYTNGHSSQNILNVCNRLG